MAESEIPPTNDSDASNRSPRQILGIGRRDFIKSLSTSTAIGLSLLGGCSTLADTSTDPPTERPTTEKTTAQEKGIGVGVYLGDESALEPWEEWFGRTADYYSFTVPQSGWDKYRIENMPFEVPIEPIASERNITVTAKMFPPNKSTLSAVAAGEHTSQHQRLARSLIRNGMSSATLRFGHELNGRWSSDGAVDRPELFIEAWKQVINTMDSVAEGDFSYMWAPHIGRVHMDPTTAYPGDQWVDVIGLTVYDKGALYYPAQCEKECISERRKRTWDRIVGQDFGLDDWAEFARQHQKPLAFPEYGVVARSWNDVGGGDNPLFIENFAQWIAENSDVVKWHNVWSFVAGPHFVGPTSLHVSEQYPPHPTASSEFKSWFA